MSLLQPMTSWIRNLIWRGKQPRRRKVSAWTSPLAGIQDLEPRIVLIVNGLETISYPAVGIVGDQHFNMGTGTLIAPHYVLTAAHVVAGVADNAGHFTVGDHTYQSDRIWINPNYDHAQLGTDSANDLALIRLNEPVTGVEPVPLFRGTPEIGETLTLVGFGSGGTSTGGSTGDFGTKRAGATPIDSLTSTLLRWKFDHASESNTANGDSGGPAFLTVAGVDYLAGVTSGGNSWSAALGDNSFDTRVDAFLDWIDAFVGSPTQPATPLLSIVATDNLARETKTSVTADPGSLTIQRLDPGTTDLVVTLNIKGTATNGSDYLRLSKTVVIPAGQTSVVVTIKPRNDSTAELNESVIVTLEANSNYTIEPDLSTASVTLIDDDRIMPQISVTANDSNAAETEWNLPSNKGQFTITRTGPVSSPLSVSFTVSGTAKSGVDYIPIITTVTIPARSSSVTVDVIPFDDASVESTETIIVTLTRDDLLYSLVAAKTTATVNLSDNDRVFIGNDLFTSATVLTGLNISVTGDNRQATIESDEPLNAGISGGKSVWWTWTAPASGSVTLSTAGSSFDTNVGVYIGNSVSALSRVTDNDDEQASRGLFTSRVIFSATANTTYRIKIDGYRGFSGTIKLNLALT